VEVNISSLLSCPVGNWRAKPLLSVVAGRDAGAVHSAISRLRGARKGGSGFSSDAAAGRS
jgi:hypothetical protein